MGGMGGQGSFGKVPKLVCFFCYAASLRMEAIQIVGHSIHEEIVF